ncbi:hypothetical protein BKA81DRAFT_347912 [Phyllosticta paracitricarpa]
MALHDIDTFCLFLFSLIAIFPPIVPCIALRNDVTILFFGSYPPTHATRPSTRVARKIHLIIRVCQSARSSPAFICPTLEWTATTTKGVHNNTPSSRVHFCLSV